MEDISKNKDGIILLVIIACLVGWNIFTTNTIKTDVKGYGKKIMEYTFNNKIIKNIDKIYLTVDKVNDVAINLYKKFNFYIVDEKEYYFTMCCYTMLKNNL